MSVSTVMHKTEQALMNENVLFLVEVINCNDGITAYCDTLINGLKTCGVNIILVSGEIRSDEKSLFKRNSLQAAVKEWIELPSIKKIPSLDLLRKIVGIIKKNNIKVINVHGLGMLIWGRLLSIMTGVRFVATYHPSVLGSLETVRTANVATFTPVQKAFLNTFFPDKLIILSEESKELVSGNVLFRKDRILKIYGGTDLTYFFPPSAEARAEARAFYGLTPSDYVCLLVGRLAWNKGQDLLISAIRKIRDKHPDLSIKCFFVGSGGQEREKEIKSFAHSGDEKDSATFQFLGMVVDVRKVLWAADVFVLPSRFEGFALVVTEAMATGLVPIRTPSGGARDQIIDGESGYIVPFEDADALGAAVMKLTDESRRDAMSKRCIARSNALFGVEPMVTKMLQAYGLT